MDLPQDMTHNVTHYVLIYMSDIMRDHNRFVKGSRCGMCCFCRSQERLRHMNSTLFSTISFLACLCIMYCKHQAES